MTGRGKAPLKFIRENKMRVFTTPSITRLARKAGIKSITEKAVSEMRDQAIKALKELIRIANIYREGSAKDIKKARKRITIQDVNEASIKVLGIKPYGDPITKRCELMTVKKGKERRSRPGTKALREIVYYQKQSNCLYLNKSPFAVYVKTILGEYADAGTSITTNANFQLQTIIENYIVRFLSQANLAAIHAKRTRVRREDIVFIKKLKS